MRRFVKEGVIRGGKGWRVLLEVGGCRVYKMQERKSIGA
jgi:hypothetical protein